MLENFAEMYRKLRTNQVGIIIDGEKFSQDIYDHLSELREKLKEIGGIRIAEIMYENSIPEKVYERLVETGFKERVFPGNIDLSFLLETYDMVLEKKIETMVIGTNNEDLKPLFTELRKQVSIFAVVEDINELSTGFTECFDGIIEFNKIQEYTFTGPSIEELDQFIQSNSSETEEVTDFTGNGESVDNANIGTFSEEIIENEDLLEEMKKENDND